MDRVWVRCDEAMYADEWLLVDEWDGDTCSEAARVASEVAEQLWGLAPASHRGGPLTIVIEESKGGRELARVRVTRVVREEFRAELMETGPREGQDECLEHRP